MFYKISLFLLMIFLFFQKTYAASPIEEAEEILAKVELLKEQSQKTQGKNVSEVLSNVEKSQNSIHYQASADWIKTNQNELFAKQAKALPKIDYGITAKEREKDAIAKLLNSYRFKPEDIKTNQTSNYPLMIFVSASIPKSSLKDLMIQAREAGGVLVFRGLIEGSIRNSQQFLAEIAKENVSAIIDPRLFESFTIELVPSFVLLARNSQDCEQSNCNFTPIHDRITGNITLNYALEQFAAGDGQAKNVAQRILAQIQNRGGRL